MFLFTFLLLCTIVAASPAPSRPSKGLRLGPYPLPQPFTKSSGGEKLGRNTAAAGSLQDWVNKIRADDPKAHPGKLSGGRAMERGGPPSNNVTVHCAFIDEKHHIYASPMNRSLVQQNIDYLRNISDEHPCGNFAERYGRISCAGDAGVYSYNARTQGYQEYKCKVYAEYVAKVMDECRPKDMPLDSNSASEITGAGTAVDNIFMFGVVVSNVDVEGKKAC
ncbi:hypothetical protein F4778DRAFT_730941 [Xylariomycetidae sp. FL2044]|nr:hypothetical protein F4778DRAFT_730941 [Xylariomycetidae sp. FL2044]